MLDVSPKEAKRDERLHKSGSLKAFRYQNEDFPLIPQTVFYDFIYIIAIKQSFTTDEKKKQQIFFRLTACMCRCDGAAVI